MLIKAFDLKDKIKKYNQISHNNYLETETFRFRYFDNQFANSIEQLIDGLRNCHELYIFNKEESKYVKTLQQRLRVIIRDHQTSKDTPSYQKCGIYNHLPLTEEMINTLKESINSKTDFYKRLNDNWHELNRKLLDASLTAADNLYEIANRWKKQGLLARCNDTAIYKIASEFLPQLTSYVTDARKELILGYHQIPNEIAHSYRQYLLELEQEIKKYQTILIESMLVRIRAYDESKGDYSNPVIYFQKLMNASINSKSNDLNVAIKSSQNTLRQPYNICSEEFNYFQSYIQKHGMEFHRKQLYKASWFKENSSMRTTVVQTEDNGCIVTPEKLKSYIPIKKRWPNWLFRDVNLRQDILKESQFLFSSLLHADWIHAEDKPQFFIDIYDHLSIKRPLDDIKRCELLIAEEQSKLNKPPTSEVSWFSFGTKRLIKEWQSYIEEQHLKIIEKKFDLAERLINCVKSQVVSPMDIPWQSYEILFNLSQELEILVKNKIITQALQQKMFTINSTLSRYASVNKIMQILKNLAKGDLSIIEELDYLHRFIDGHLNIEPNFLPSFLKFCEPYLKLINERFLKQLKINPFSFNSSRELQAYEKLTITLYSVVSITRKNITNNPNNEITSNIISEKDVEKQQKILLKMFLQYLQKLYMYGALNTHGNNITTKTQLEQLNVSKNILLSVGKKTSYLGDSLVKHIQLLDKLKLENPILFRVNCQALILSLSNKLLGEHFDKELLEFDELTYKILKEQNLSDEAIGILLKMKELLIQDGSPETINFTPSELNMLNGKLPSSTINITSILKCNAKAHQVKSQLSSNDSNALSINKSLLVKNLSQDISEKLRGYQRFALFEQNKAWFAKQYLDKESLGEYGLHKYLIL